MNCLVFKFKQRNPEDISNKCLAEIYVKGPKCDIDLISTDQKVFSAHKFVVFMFSGYLKEYIREFKPKGKACVPLSDVSSFVLKQVIDLFYNGQIMVGTEVKPHIVKALELLKVKNIVIQKPEQQLPPTSTNAEVPRLVPSPTQPVLNKKPLMSTQPVNGHAPNMNQSQYGSIQAAKRQRTQSMYIAQWNTRYMERPVQGTGIDSTPSVVPQMNGLPTRIGGVSIVKKTAVPVSNPTALALSQKTQLSISRVQGPVQQSIVQSAPNVGSVTISKVGGANDIDDDDNDDDEGKNIIDNGHVSAA